ncbi:MAG: methyltransferase domain-containing protein [Acidobacteria bacterium]|nr:methyltransferase domain-containing protein [Acidobacteriota bacterium]
MTEFTGERVVPGEVEIDLLNEHLARYAFAARLARGKRVLDAGCGLGYGAARLVPCARRVVALEIDSQAVETARRQYACEGLDFLRGDCRELPFPDGSFDLVVAFEVIEHLEQWERLLAESRRVLAPWGELVVSTPNRLYYTESRDTVNPFHVHEFEYGEFCEALERHFPHLCVFLENHADGVVFSPLVASGVETAIESVAAEPSSSHFFVAVCSARPLHGSPAFVYIPRSANVLREREQHIALLEHELEQKNHWLEQAKQDLSQLHENYQTLEREARQAIQTLEEENLRKTEWSRQSEAEVERLKGLLENLQVLFDERTAWALQLEAERADLAANYQRLEAEAEKVRADLKACVNQLHATEADLEERTRWAQSLDRQREEMEARIARLTADLNSLYGSPAYRIGKRLGLAPVPPSDPKRKIDD